MSTPRIEVLTVAECARELRVCVRTVQQLFRRRLLKRTKIGRRSLIRRSELEKFLERNTR